MKHAPPREELGPPAPVSRLRWLPGFMVVFTASVPVLFCRFLPGAFTLSRYEDDFFYYLVVARNLALHGLSTFDGTHWTNGYHPLWLLVLTATFKVLPAHAVLYAIGVWTLIAVLVTYWLTYRCLCSLTNDAGLAGICAAFYSLLCLEIAKSGMEVTLTFPLLALFLGYRLRPGFHWTRGQSLALGFLGSLVILSRLDSGVLIVLVLLCDGIHYRFPLKRTMACGSLFVAGSGLVGVYLWVNKSVFGVWLPISATAKELRRHHWPSAAPIRSMLMPFHPLKPGLAAPIVCGLAAEIFLFAAMVRMRRQNRGGSPLAVASAIFLFPIVHLTLLSLLSDWPLWIWYFYPLVLAVFGASVAWAHLRGVRRSPLSGARLRFMWIALAATAVLYATTLEFHLRRTPSEEAAIVLAGQDIQHFAESHPGIYAMGDRAGAPGWLTSSPIVQLEGLMMDRNYLVSLRAQPSLLNLLRQYHVRYYIATNPARQQGCYLAVEPAKAEGDSIKVHALLCDNPVATFVHRGTVTAIFDLDAPQLAEPVSNVRSTREDIGNGIQ